jgi:hypothetical protein
MAQMRRRIFVSIALSIFNSLQRSLSDHTHAHVFLNIFNIHSQTYILCQRIDLSQFLQCLLRSTHALPQLRANIFEKNMH